MIRKFNYTNRIRINRRDVLISLSNADDGVSVETDLSRISGYGLPPHSPVFLEAYRQTNWMRFDCGEIRSITQLKNFHLIQFNTHEGILFRIKVTQKGDIHKLIAVADSIPLLKPYKEKSPREPLLPVKPTELGDEIYKLDFSDDHPILLINKDVGDYKSITTHNVFMALVYPGVLREILTRIYLIDEYFDDDDMENWRSKWIRFIKLFSGMGEAPRSDDKDECEVWIEKAVRIFAKRNKTKKIFVSFWSDAA